MTDMDKKVIGIRIEFEDGTVLKARDVAADSIWKWWRSAEVMWCMHGAAYIGAGFEEERIS